MPSNGDMRALRKETTKLAKAQVRTDQTIQRLSKQGERLNRQQDRTEAIVQRLGVHLDHLGAYVEGVAQRIDALGKRFDEFREAVLRGFTDAAARDRGLADRVSAIEQKQG